ncbi:YciI family protein [Glycomyces sp. L485]|uniref:YciI family protein n=1 Tax=Glycomyces sp. L485 TaxID=2909235 RepID=UPI001F4A36E2|nr:YciI family protein [Glycomyces sp. L485]MCH7232407.1 YciI family protein [Glycomyces sp. L485]
MRYLINVVHEGPIDEQSVPAEMYEAMGGFVAKLAADGILIDGAGLEPTEKATRVNLRDGEVKVVDGPFAEAKEWVGGYFLVQCRGQDEAVEIAKHSIELHRKHVPGMNVVHEVRRIIDEE